jgi:hypothetical protein
MQERLTETRNIVQGFIHMLAIVVPIAAVAVWVVWLSSSALQALGSVLAPR